MRLPVTQMSARCLSPRTQFGTGWRYPSGLVALFWLLFIGVTQLSQSVVGKMSECYTVDASTPLARFSPWVLGDACWYLRIAAQGYLPADPAVAFFPLYPLLTHFVSVLLAGNTLLAGVAVSWGAALLAGVGLCTLIRHDFTPAIARTSLLLTFSFPSAFFLFLPFTEALFLALVAWTLYAARRGHWLPVAPLLLLASLTRAQGLFLALPIAWELGQQWHRGRIIGRTRWLVAPIPLLSFGGFFLFIVYSRATTGWSTLEAQTRYWGAAYSPPWETLALSWRYFQRTGSIVELLNIGLLLLFGALWLGGIRRIPFMYSLYVFPQLALLLTRHVALSPLASASRYLLVLFPIFVILALCLRPGPARLLWLSGALLLWILLLGFALNGAFVA